MRVLSLAVLTLVFSAASATAQTDPPGGSGGENERPTDPKQAMIEDLLKEIAQLRASVAELRQQMATMQLERDAAGHELDELRQFIKDNREYGDDFLQYKEIKEVTVQAERRRVADQARRRKEEQRQRRIEQRNLERGLTPELQAERQKVEQYQRAGFQPLGLDVYLGRSGFFYDVKEETGLRVEYEPFIGRFLEPGIPRSRIDYSKMTISGTILNASEEIRNVGVAVAFFDNRGNQVGAETVLINNARPNVPYPFTSTLEMALNGPFASSTSWVLYADSVSTDDGTGSGN